MTEKLETVLEKVSNIPNPVNSSLIQELYQYMVDNRKSVAIYAHIGKSGSSEDIFYTRWMGGHNFFL
jgi:hypothetical protein